MNTLDHHHQYIGSSYYQPKICIYIIILLLSLQPEAQQWPPLWFLNQNPRWNSHRSDLTSQKSKRRFLQIGIFTLRTSFPVRKIAAFNSLKRATASPLVSKLLGPIRSASVAPAVSRSFNTIAQMTNYDDSDDDCHLDLHSLSDQSSYADDDDLYSRLKSLQRQLEFIDIQEEYVKDEQKNLKCELLRVQEEVKRIQSAPLVIGQFMERVDQNNGIVGSTTGSNYY